MLTYPEPNVVLEGMLEAKNTVTPLPMIAMPITINTTKVVLLFVLLPVGNANSKRTIPGSNEHY